MKHIPTHLALIFALVVPVYSDEAPAVARDPVAIINVGNADPSVVERARLWAEENLAIPVPQLDGFSSEGLSTFNDVSAKAAALITSNRLGVVVLWMHDTDVDSHGAFFPEEKVVVVNMKAMMNAPDAETAARRVERQVIRGICFTMGLELNPNPQSAMFGYTAREELDLIGRNLDPPWLLRVQEKALEYGIPVNPDSPQCLIFPPTAEEPPTQE